MDRILDLRSDTVTVPCEKMREAMKNAVVGDDILRDDPTVKELEELIADILGYESALFAISGTMANQIAVMCYTQRGEEVIVGEKSHIYNLEVAALSTLSQTQARTVTVVDGEYNVDEIERAIQPEGVQKATTGLICLENTYDLNAGFPIPMDNLRRIKKLSEKNNIPLYMDGARLFNAAISLGVPASEICRYADAVQICMTKGLGAPLGSVLAGTKDFIDKARRIKQRIGGGMRQAGVIAAPAIYALNNNISRLREDHENALKLAEGFSKIDGLFINLDKVRTNIVSPEITKPGWNIDMLLDRLDEYGIKAKKLTKTSCRFVMHLQISSNDVKEIIERTKAVLN